MGMTQRLVLVAAIWLLAAASIQPAHADEEAAARDARWAELQRAIFPEKQIRDGAQVLELEAPPRALDAALVPLTVNILGDTQVKTVWLVIDNNPGPLAGRFDFGPAADPRTLKVRMRVNSYTNIHAVAEDADERLWSVAKFVKAAGGCSAPAGADTEKSLQELGQMRVKLLNEFTAGEPMQAQLMIRHPNFNGMQMDQVTRLYTPPHFIKTIDVSYEGEKVLRVESDIALSTDPVISFGFTPKDKGRLKIVVEDSKERSFSSEFEVPESHVLSEARGKFAAATPGAIADVKTF